jgi:hypothetical protein
VPKELRSDQLRPYLSILLAEVDDDDTDVTINSQYLLKRLRRLLGIRSQSGSRRIRSQGEADGAAFVHYTQTTGVPWTTLSLTNAHQQLALVLVHGRWVAIATTENVSAKIQKAIREKRKRTRPLGNLKLITPGHLKAAFMRGRARTLWLRGMHRPTSFKADTKVLGGSDLEPALDPLADQTYRFTAARAEPGDAAIADVMGVAVDQSRVWVGPSEDWDAFRDVVVAILERLDASVGVTAHPLPALASTVADLDDLSGAYDIAITPPELLTVGPLLDPAEAADLAALEEIAFATTFSITATNGAALQAQVARSGQRLGEVEIGFAKAGEEIETSVLGTAEAGREADFEQIRELLHKPEGITVYYDSGHAIQHRRAYSVSHRDLPFSSWSWVDFGSSSWAVEREKPAGGIAKTGTATDTSLFDWVFAEWPQGAGVAGARGWLACDDRPGETADFLHIDESGAIPTLTLIHVKGAHSASDQRQISVVPYETVCAQAIKNLRHLDQVLAREEMLSGTIPAAIGMAAWRDGSQITRNDFLDRLDQLGTNMRRRVVIAQPHVRKSLLEDVRAQGAGHPQLPRLRRLDALLLETASACQSAGAAFLVVAADA